MLRANGFEVFGVGCKTGEILRLSWASTRPTRAPAPWPATRCSRPSCSTRRGRELNIVMGLCVGHDSLFYKHAKAVTTTLVVKDRSWSTTR